MGMTAEVAREASEVYGDYLREQVDAQDAYKKSIEDRAVAVITSASTVAALLFAFAAFITGGSTAFAITPWALAALGASLVLFAGAAALAVYVNMPRDYQGPVADDIKRLLEESWTSGESPQSAGYRVAGARVVIVKSAKGENQRKARYLMWAVAAEFGAIAGLALGVAAAFMRL